VYTGTLAHIVALSQALHEELKFKACGYKRSARGVVATEFHERQDSGKFFGKKSRNRAAGGKE
jgi:short-subunit dehydrogenase